MAKLIAAVYGDALFELAVEGKKLDRYQKEIPALQSILKANVELSELMQHPKVLKEEKQQVLERIFKGCIDDELLGFLVLLLKKDRYSSVLQIMDYFMMRVKEYWGIGVAEVTSAKPLSAGQKDGIVRKLTATTGYTSMEMHYSVDESLIGGIVIRIGDRVVDGSIRTRLEELQRELLNVQL